MILRLSQKLSTKLKEGSQKTMPLDENPYADWSCHLFTADRTQYILVSNTKSLYSCVMFGKGITDDSTFIERTLGNLCEFMEDDGQAFVYQRFIAPAAGTISFAKALDRSVISSMNQLMFHATAWLEDGDISPHDVGFKLNDVLLSTLGTKENFGYGKLNEAFRAMGTYGRTTIWIIVVVCQY